MTENTSSRTAPFYNIPSRQIVSIEHPAIIKNVDKAIETLQGSAGIVKVSYLTLVRNFSNSVIDPQSTKGRYSGQSCAPA
jgi:general transcription factor 3C polypeptide 5 (transcription factor C subunit 1)